MTDLTDNAVRAILLQTEAFLQEGLAAAGLDVSYVLVAVAPNGEVCLTTNVETPEVQDMVAEIDEAVGEAMGRPVSKETN